MDDNTTGQDASVSENTAPVESMNTTGTDAPAPATTPSEGNPEPTGPGPETTDPDLPDHGINPDKGIDPDAGDLPTNPDAPLETAAQETENITPDLKAMSRAERAQYFQSLQDSTRKDVETKVNEVYQPQSADELTQKYLDQGHTEFEARMLAREEQRDQETDINRARAERAELNANLATEAMEVLNSVEWLNPTNKSSFDEKASDAATSLYDQLCLTRDDNTAELDANGNPIPGTGQIIGATMTPKQFYGLMDTIRNSGSETARQAAMKAAEEQMAAVAAPSSNTTRRSTPFDDLSADEMKAQLLAQGINVT